MTDPKDRKPIGDAAASRRSFLKRAAFAAAAIPLVHGARQASAAATDPAAGSAAPTGPAVSSDAEPFWGRHQGGIATPMQRHTYFAAFDVTTNKRDDIAALMRAWTQAAAQMTSGPAQFDPKADLDQSQPETGATVGLPASRLTITFGFGPSLFESNGQDRFGLRHLRPAALADLPRFAGEQLSPDRTGGDLSVQACADDAQVVEAALRRLATLAYGVAGMRWAQTGFAGGFKPGETPRNTMGFKDGTMNVPTDNPKAMNEFVWAGDEGPAWMRDGSYMVIRPIRISLEHWDRMKVSFQEQTVGRHKASGAPIGKTNEYDPLDLDHSDKDGNPLIAENAHVAMAAPERNDGAQILRRGYSYDNGIVRVAERWPPWRQVTTFDSGLLFQCYQRDPRTGFTRIFAKMALVDMLNQFTTHVGSGVFACPPGAKPGEYVGQALLG
jgi:deferrochelatase/peroxidase EfeB